MGWTEGVLAAFDIETTGLDPVDDELVQVAVILVDPSGELLPESWSTIVDPEREIPPEASRVHGITNDRASREGIPHTEAATRTLDRLEAIATSQIPLVVFNAPFDLGFMQIRAKQAGRLLPDVQVVDPLVCDREADRYRRGSRTLEAVARHYDCNPGQLHDAQTDALVSVSVARAIGRRFPTVGELTPADLHDAQVVWHRAWAENFAGYQRRQGRDASSVDLGWAVPRRLGTTVSGPARPSPRSSPETPHAAPSQSVRTRRAPDRPWWRIW